jgi:S-DNA-T family DNA segregation ATPase FtsK/SpoIIIE
VQRELLALALLVAAGLCVVGLLSWSGGGQGVVGLAGGLLARMFGVAAWLVPAVLVVGAAALVFGPASGSASGGRWASPTLPIGLLALLVGMMGLAHILVGTNVQTAEAGQGGGYLGLFLFTFLAEYLTTVGAGIVLVALALAGFMLTFGVSLAQLVHAAAQLVRAIGSALSAAPTLNAWLAHKRNSTAATTPNQLPILINGQMPPADTAPLSTLGAEASENGETLQYAQHGPHPAPTEAIDLPALQPVSTAPAPGRDEGAGGGRDSALAPGSPVPDGPDRSSQPVINIMDPGNGKGWPDAQSPPTTLPAPVPSPLGYLWQLPPLTLLDNTGEVKVSEADIKAKVRIIENTLHSFNVEAVVREVNTGPAVTQFALEPGVGVRVSRITALEKDLALALAAPHIRIEAPIPGQSRIGIEVPNVSLQVVGLRGVMESEVFHSARGRLKIALGRDTHGQPVVTDLTKLPHLLVAGATGSGKSVFLNSMVIGFLLQHTPDDLRMLMIDPKRVELTGFNGIPHLLRPVVTDVRLEKDQHSRHQPPGPRNQERDRPLTAVEALKWALWEMERRYKLFAKGQRTKEGVSRVFRNIEQYRAFLKDNPDTGMEHLPYIVIIIDELADLMLTAPEEVETSLCRLAQLARATGIHLVVATQRPSVDVVTGLIKANFPARAAFAVTSQVDSKVILDQGGAEKLLGRGDMLYTASDESKPVRIQGTFVSDAESERVVNFWRRQLPSPEELADNGIQAPVQPMPMPDWLGTGDPDEESELLEQAIELVKRNNYVSVSMIQRKLRVGYNRAARLIEQMEEMGLIAPADGDNRGRPREVLLGTPDHRAFSFEAEEPDRTRT